MAQDDLGFVADEKDDLGFVADAPVEKKQGETPSGSKGLDLLSALVSPVNYLSNKMVEETKKDPTVLATAASGFGDAALFGLTDKLGGAVAAGADVAQRLGNKIAPSMVDKSTSQLNEELKNQGFTGDLGPTSPMETYRQTRDDVQNYQNALAAQSPKTSIVSNLAGGTLGVAGLTKAAPGVAQALFNPIQNSANASTLAKMATGAANAIPTSLALGLEASNADFTKGELPSVSDVAVPLAIGAGTGAAIPGLIAGYQGAKNAVGKIKNSLGKSLDETAFNLGKQGHDITSPDFIKSVQQETSELVPQVSAEVKAQRNANKAELNKYKQDISDIEKQFAEKRKELEQNVNNLTEQELQNQKDVLKYQEEQVKSFKNELKAQEDLMRKKTQEGIQAKNQEKINKLDDEMVNVKQKLERASGEEGAALADKLENKIEDQFDTLGKSYDDFDKRLDDKKVVYNFLPEVESFLAYLPENIQSSLQKRLSKLSVSNLDRTGFVDLRNNIQKMMKSTPSLEEKLALRDLLGKLRDNQLSTIEQQVGPEVAQELLNLNKQYSQLKGIQKNFFSGANETGKKSISTIKAFDQNTEAAADVRNRLKQQAEQASLLDQLVLPIEQRAAANKNLLNTPEMQALEAQKASIKSVKGTALDEAVNAELAQNPQYKQLQDKITMYEDRLTAIKNTNPSAENSPEVLLAQKQLDLLQKNKDAMLKSAQDKLTQAEENILNAKTSVEKLTKPSVNDIDIDNSINKILTNPKKDAVQKSEELDSLVKFFKDKTGQDISEKVKSLQEKIGYVKQADTPKASSLETAANTAQALQAPVATGVKALVADSTVKSKIANKLGQSMRGANRTSVTTSLLKNDAMSMADTAAKMGMVSLSNRLKEISQMPEEKKNEEIFLLMQQPTFRKLMGTDKK